MKHKSTIALISLVFILGCAKVDSIWTGRRTNIMTFHAPSKYEITLYKDGSFGGEWWYTGSEEDEPAGSVFGSYDRNSTTLRLTGKEQAYDTEHAGPFEKEFIFEDGVFRERAKDGLELVEKLPN